MCCSTCGRSRFVLGPMKAATTLPVMKPGTRSRLHSRRVSNRYSSFCRRLHAELSLIWAAPGSAQATYQPNAPDADHSPAFWSSLAATFKNDPDVILAPWGETTVDWPCFLNGCSGQATYGSNQDGLASIPCPAGSTASFPALFECGRQVSSRIN